MAIVEETFLPARTLLLSSVRLESSSHCLAYEQKVWGGMTIAGVFATMGSGWILSQKDGLGSIFAATTQLFFLQKTDRIKFQLTIKLIEIIHD